MGKDKYSDDHTIEIVGDTNTLTVDGNLSVSGDLSASNIVGNIDISGSLDVSGIGGITAFSSTTTSQTSGSYSYSESKEVIRAVSLSELKESVAATETNVDENSYNNANGYPVLTIGGLAIAVHPTWSFNFSIDNYLLNGSKLKSIKFLMGLSLNDASPPYEFSVTVKRKDSIGDSASYTEVATDTISNVLDYSEPKYRQWYTADVNSGTIDISPYSALAQMYTVTFQKTGTNFCLVNIYRCVLVLEVGSLDVAINQVGEVIL
jgi:hypothetical protein